MCEILTLSPDFVASYLRDLVVPVWIGLSDRLHEGRFAWSDGVNPVLYTNWADKDSIPVPPPTSTPCPSGYITWYSSCYKLVSEPKSWEEAQQACVKEGGNLASVDMSYDQTDAWIGLRRLVLPHSLMSVTNVKQNSSLAPLLQAGSDSYKWSDGWPVFFTHWGPGEPTDHEGEGCNCVEMYHDGTWNDNNCVQKRGFVCRHRQCRFTSFRQTLKPFLSRHGFIS
uniref:C-type lectin domain-containing protein n=1 Tax=Sinocyclocheilus rhinocerous TaxID=307959 RepID=A0A673H974_9TELE